MIEALAQALHASELSRTLRASIWLYPLVNTAHLGGLALLVGGIVPLDLRLAGCWREVPLRPLARVLVRSASTGLALAVGSGALLFAARPLDYVGEPLFGLKLALLAAALANALLLRRSPAWRHALGDGGDSLQSPAAALRRAGIVSIALWLGVVAAGRLIGYR
jgi:hypothetical protein